MVTPDRLEVVPITDTRWWPELWVWMRQAPDLNCDDATPSSLEQFVLEMEDRRRTERVWGVRWDGRPVGVIGYAPIRPEAGLLHGICFDAAVHGAGIARPALERVLDGLFADGVDWIGAAFFTTNVRVRRFLDGFGARPVGQYVSDTTQHGQPMTLQVVELTRPSEGETLCR